MLAKMLLRKANAAKTLSYITSANSAAATITIPAAAAIGDIAVLVDKGWGGTNPPTTVVPTNWTQIDNRSFDTSPGVRSILSYKVLVSGDPGASITGMTATFYLEKLMLIFRPSASGTVSIANATGAVVDTNPVAQVVPANTSPYIVVGACSSYSAAPAWASTWYDATFTKTYLKLAYKLFNSSPASVSVDTNDAGSGNALQSCAIVVT